MNTTDFNNPDDLLDRATADRLARLNAMPVDTTRLAARLVQQVPKPAERRRQSFFLLRAVRYAAASFLVLAIILAAVISSSSGPALASPDRLARVHEEMTSGKNHAMKVSSIEAASAALSEQWPKAPALPDLPDDHVMACCVHEMGRKKMACVSLAVDNVPITMAVADSAQVKVPQGTMITRDGVTWHIDSANGVNMAMMQQGGRWVCLMGRLPVDRLIDVGGQLRF